MTSKKDVGKKANTDVSTEVNYGEYEGAGFENQSRDDYSIPFLEILQGLSPEIETLDGAKPGMIINKVTQDLAAGDEGIIFVPCYTQHVYVEWVPRDAGGGMVATHELDSEFVANAKANSKPMGAIELDSGNQLMETFYVFGIQVLADGTTNQAVMAFASTKIKKYKAWMTKARTIQIRLPDGRKINPPLFAHKYRMKTVKQQNKKGTFHNWEISFDGTNALEARLKPNEEIFQEAAQVMELVKSGQAKADLSSQSSEAGSKSDDEGKTVGPDGKPVF